MILVETQRLKLDIEKQTNLLMNGMVEELDKRHVGGDTFQAKNVLDEVSKIHEKIIEVMNAGHERAENITMDANFDDCLQIQDNENNLIREPIQETLGGNRRVVLSWNNCSNGQMKLLPTSFKFPSMPLPNLVRMWYCGDMTKNIPPYQALRSFDVKHLKIGKTYLSMMKYIMKHVERAALIVNQPHLVKNRMSVQDSFGLYHAIKHMFKFDCLRVGKKRRYETISWKTYYNILVKRKGKLMGEGG